MEEQDWNTLSQESESNAWGGARIKKNVADLESNVDCASSEYLLPERGQGRSGHQQSVGYYEASSELGSRTKHRSRKPRKNESDDLLSRSEEHRPRRSSKSRDDELVSRSQHCSPPRSTASKTREHRQGRRKSLSDFIPPDILEEEFNLKASQIFEFEKQSEEEDAFGTMFVASTTLYFRKSLETSSTRRKDNSAKYEYKEPGAMTFGKKKQPTPRRSLDAVGGDESFKWGSGHGDLVGPKRSGRAPRRSSMGALPNASMPGSMSNQHVTETYSAVEDSSVLLTAPVDGRRSSSKSRTPRRGGGSMTGSNSLERHEKLKFEDKTTHNRKSTSSRSSNLDAFLLGIQTDFSPPKASGGRSVHTSVTEARKNSSKARRRNSMNGGHYVEEYGALSKNHDVSEKHESKEHRPCRRSGPPTHHRTRATRRSSIATCSTYSSDSHDLHGEEPRDMTRSGRAPRRSSMGALPSASMPGSMMSNQHVTETYSAADSSVLLTAPVDGRRSSSKSRTPGRGSMTGSNSLERHEKLKSEDKAPYNRKDTSSGSSNLDAFLLGIQTDFSPPKASGGRSVYTSVTEARKNSSKARRRNSMNGGHYVEEHGALSKNHDVSKKHESKEHRPCSKSGSSPLHHRTRATRRSSIATCITYWVDSHDTHGVSPVEAQATEREETPQKARSSSRHRAARRSSIGSATLSPESHDNSSGAFPPHRGVSQRSSHGDASRMATEFEAARIRRRMPRRSRSTCSTLSSDSTRMGC